MNKVKIITDSTSDLSSSYRIKYGIDFLPMVYTINGISHLALLDYSNEEFENYYEGIRNGKRVTSNVIDTKECETIFKKYLDAGFDIIYLSCSSKLSGSLVSARIIANELLEKYPNQKIACIDSLRSCFAQGMMAIEAAKKANANYSFDDIVSYLHSYRLHYQTYAISPSLLGFYRTGRVKVDDDNDKNLNRNAIVVSDSTGGNYAWKYCSSEKQALVMLSSMVKRRISEQTPIVMIEHSGCIDKAMAFKEILSRKTGIEDIRIQYIGVIVGASVGADFMMVSFYGKKVTIGK